MTLRFATAEEARAYNRARASLELLERPHFTERFRTLDAVRWADRVAADVVRHRLHMARGELGLLLQGGGWFWGFHSHCIDLRIDRLSRRRRLRLETAARIAQREGLSLRLVDTAARALCDGELYGLEAVRGRAGVSAVKHEALVDQLRREPGTEIGPTQGGGPGGGRTRHWEECPRPHPRFP